MLSQVDSPDKIPEEPIFDTKLPEVSESDSSLYRPSFTPSYDHTQCNIHRTTIIARILADITLSSILERVRGGAILSAHLLNTIRITGFKTVQVVFLEQSSAISYEEHAPRHPSKFSVYPSLAVHHFPRSVTLSGAVWQVNKSAIHPDDIVLPFDCSYLPARLSHTSSTIRLRSSKPSIHLNTSTLSSPILETTVDELGHPIYIY